MNCELEREELVAFFYGESADRDRIERHVAACASCRSELDALQSTSALLQTWPDEDPRLDLTFVEAPAPRRRFNLPAWGSIAAGFGTAIAAVVLFMAFAEFEISYRAGQLDLKWGPALAADETQTPPLTRAELLAVQEHTLELVDQLMRASETRQQQTLGQALTLLARDLETRRHQDLQLVGRRFDQFDHSTQTRFRRNESALMELIPARYDNDQ